MGNNLKITALLLVIFTALPYAALCCNNPPCGRPRDAATAESLTVTSDIQSQLMKNRITMLSEVMKNRAPNLINFCPDPQSVVLDEDFFGAARIGCSSDKALFIKYFHNPFFSGTDFSLSVAPRPCPQNWPSGQTCNVGRAKLFYHAHQPEEVEMPLDEIRLAFAKAEAELELAKHVKQKESGSPFLEGLSQALFGKSDYLPNLFK